MKRKGISIILLGFLIVVIAGIGIWRHHYLKITNADPIKVYKYTPREPNTSPKDKVINKRKTDKGTQLGQETLPKDRSIENDDSTDLDSEHREMAKSNDIGLSLKEKDDTANQTVHHIFSDIVVEKLPPKAAAALKEYEEIQLATPIRNKELEVLLDTPSPDFDAIGEFNEKSRVIRERRMDLLEILSIYSKQALAEIQATIKRGKAAERIVEEVDEDPNMDVDDIMRRLEELTK